MKNKLLRRTLVTLSCILLLSLSVRSEALDIDRMRQLPSCVLAEDLSSIEDLERKGWSTASAPTVLSSPYGNVLDFDGTDDSFTTTLYSDKTVKTILFWAKPDTTTEQFVDLDGNTNYIHVSSGTLTATGFTTPTRYVDGVAATAMVADTWHMVAVTTGTAITTTSIKVGTDGSAFGDTSLKNIIMFDRVLSAQEISDIYNGTTFDYWQNEVSHWDMSEINPQDIGWKGNGNDGTGVGLVASTDIVRAKGDWGTEFNGSDELITIAESADFSFNGTTDTPFSVGGLVKIVAGATNQVMLGKYNDISGSAEWLVGLESNEKLIFVLKDNSVPAYNYKTADVAISAGWHFVTYTYDGGGGATSANGIILYADGVAVASTATNNANYVAMERNVLLYPTIGASKHPNTYWAGSINDVFLYNTELTTLAIEDLYVRSGR